MPQWNAFSFAFGPLIGFLGIGVLVLIVRWTFSRGHSLVARPARSGNPADYGMLVSVASPDDYIQGEILRRQLADAGVKATLATTSEGPRVLTWPGDQVKAQSILSRGR